jgi:hypothetical protein
LAILDNEQRQIDQKNTNLAQQNQLISIEPLSLKKLNEEISNAAAAIEITNQQAQIQRKREEVENQMSQQKKAEAQVKNEQKRIENTLQVYDYAISRLYSSLIQLASDTKKQLNTDLTNGPIIRLSNMVKDGNLIAGTNVISLGTNSPWKFKIDSNPSYNQNGLITRLTIVSQGKDSHPIFVDANSQGIFVRFMAHSMSPEPDSYENPMSVNEMNRITDYKNVIDSGILKLLVDEQKQFPLTTNR